MLLTRERPISGPATYTPAPHHHPMGRRQPAKSQLSGLGKNHAGACLNKPHPTHTVPRISALTALYDKQGDKITPPLEPHPAVPPADTPQRQRTESATPEPPICPPSQPKAANNGAHTKLAHTSPSAAPTTTTYPIHRAPSLRSTKRKSKTPSSPPHQQLDARAKPKRRQTPQMRDRTSQARTRASTQLPHHRNQTPHKTRRSHRPRPDPANEDEPASPLSTPARHTLTSRHTTRPSDTNRAQPTRHILATLSHYPPKQGTQADVRRRAQPNNRHAASSDTPTQRIMTRSPMRQSPTPRELATRTS